MATTHSAPIDLYAESREGFDEAPRGEQPAAQPWTARPGDNGDRDEPAIDAGRGRLEQVL